jgi:hypothetical protein
LYDVPRGARTANRGKLHVAESLCIIDIADNDLKILHANGSEPDPCDDDIFTLRRVELCSGETLAIAAERHPVPLRHAGTLTFREGGPTLPTGTNALLPFDSAFTFRSDEGATVLLTEDFA